MKKRKKVIIITAATLAAVLVGGWFYINSTAFIRQIVLPRVAAKLGTEVKAESISFDLFSELSLDGLRIGPHSAPALFECDTLRVKYDLRAILGGNIHIKAFEVSNGSVTVVQSVDGTVSLPGLGDKDSTRGRGRDKEASSDDDSTPSGIVIENVVLENFSVVFRRTAAAGDVPVYASLSDLSLTLPQLSGGKPFTLTIATKLSVEQEGAVDVAARATLKIDGLLKENLTPSGIKVALDLTELNGTAGSRTFEDDGVKARLTLSQSGGALQLTESELTLTHAGQSRVRVPLGLSFRSDADGSMLGLELKSISLAEVAEFLPATLAVRPTHGTLKSQLSIVRPRDGGGEFAVSGTINITELGLSVNGERYENITMDSVIDLKVAKGFGETQITGETRFAVSSTARVSDRIGVIHPIHTLVLKPNLRMDEKSGMTSLESTVISLWVGDNKHMTTTLTLTTSADGTLGTAEARIELNDMTAERLAPFVKLPAHMLVKGSIDAALDVTLGVGDALATVKGTVDLKEVRVARKGDAKDTPSISAQMTVDAGYMKGDVITLEKLRLALRADNREMLDISVSGKLLTSMTGRNNRLTLTSHQPADLDALLGVVAGILDGLDEPDGPDGRSKGKGAPPKKDKKKKKKVPPRCVVNIAIPSAVYRKIKITDLKAEAVLKKGLLSVKPVTLLINGSPATLTASMEMDNDKDPEYKVSVTIDNLALAPIVTSVMKDQKPFMEGRVKKVSMTIAGNGFEKKQLERYLRGTMSFDVDSCRFIPGKDGSWATVMDVLAVLGIRQSNLIFNRGKGKLSLKKSKLKIKSLELAADDLRMRAGGNLTLRRGWDADIDVGFAFAGDLAETTAKLFKLKRPDRAGFSKGPTLRIDGNLGDLDGIADDIKKSLAVSGIGGVLKNKIKGKHAAEIRGLIDLFGKRKRRDDDDDDDDDEWDDDDAFPDDDDDDDDKEDRDNDDKDEKEDEDGKDDTKGAIEGILDLF